MILCSNPSEQFKSYKSEIEEAVSEVMNSKTYILGEQVSLLESEFAEYIETSFAIGVANGTDAIEIAIRSLNIGYGDEVITVSHTAVATVAAIEASGATAVLVDIDPNFYTLNPNQLKNALTKKTKAVITVHLYGNAVDIDSVLSFCKINEIFLIEDVSQAHGAKYKGKRLGSLGDIGCFSCYPTKNLGAIGDAGLVTTNNPDLANKIRMIREYGWKNRTSIIPGRNSRLDEIQAAILRIKLKYLDSDNQKRRDIAKLYCRELSNLPIVLPKVSVHVEPVFHLFVIQVASQKELVNFFKKEGIMLGIHYPIPIHLHPAYIDRVLISKDMSVTEDIVKKIVSLPIYPELSISDAKLIVNSLCAFFK
jgi:dTDP-4-amino-4,6-dideoxygalactose transaminase